jgi:hypothetical protein
VKNIRSNETEKESIDQKQNATETIQEANKINQTTWNLLINAKIPFHKPNQNSHVVL